jgi:hypothetical protein
LHGFQTAGEVIKALDTVNQEIVGINARIESLESQSKSLTAELKLPFDDYVRITSADMIRKYCVLAYEKHVTKHRMYALKHKKKRYWDGDDSAAFDQWLESHSYANKTGEMDAIMEGLNSSNTTDAADKDTSLSALKRSNSNRSITSHDSDTPSDEKEDREDEPEYNWDDTDHMEQRYTLNIYTRYRNEKGLSFLQ